MTEWGNWKGEVARKERIMVEKLRGMGGHFLGMTNEEREEIRKSERERMRKRRGLLVQGATPNISVATGASRLTKGMVEDEWGRNEKGVIVVGGRDKVVRRKRKVLGGVSGNESRVGKRGEKERGN